MEVLKETGLWLQSYSSFCKRHGRNLDPLVSLHLRGLDKNDYLI